MKKTIVILIIILLFVLAGGVFWWQDQKDVRELNKNLPKGVRVVKSFIGNEYRVVNKIDGYEFKVPKGLRGLKEIKYSRENVPSLSLEEREGVLIGIGCYELKTPDTDFESWVREWGSKFKDFNWIIEKERIGNFEVVIAREEQHLAGVPIYFIKGRLKIYGMSSTTEEFIREIIANGKW